MKTLNTSGFHLTFSDGDKHASLPEVKATLMGQQISDVIKLEDHSIMFKFVSGASMTLTSSGLEGDDLDLNIETAE